LIAGCCLVVVVVEQLLLSLAGSCGLFVVCCLVGWFSLGVELWLLVVGSLVVGHSVLVVCLLVVIVVSS
jgi:hypothetical protein